MGTGSTERGQSEGVDQAVWCASGTRSTLSEYLKHFHAAREPLLTRTRPRGSHCASSPQPGGFGLSYGAPQPAYQRAGLGGGGAALSIAQLQAGMEGLGLGGGSGAGRGMVSGAAWTGWVQWAG